MLRHSRIRSGLSMLGAAVVIAVRVAGPASAETVALGEKEIAYDVPAGWCQLNATNETDATLLRAAQELQGVRNQVLALFGDCGELEGARRGQAILHYGLLLGVRDPATGKPFIIPNLARSEVITQLAGAFSKRLASDMFAEMDKQLSSVGDKHGVKLQLKEPQIGVLDRDDNALYLAFASNILVNGQETANSGVTAMLPVKERIISMNIYAPYESKNTYATLLVTVKDSASRLIAKNVTAVTQAVLPPGAKMPEESNYRSSGINWERVFSKAVTGGLAGGLIALILYGARRAFGRSGPPKE